MAWLCRAALVAWLLRQTGNVELRRATSSEAVDRALTKLALVTAGVLTSPLVAWQVFSLLAPASFARARRRLVPYTIASFVVVFANLRILLSALAQRTSQFRDNTFDTAAYAPASLEECLGFYLPAIVAWVALASIVVPIFVVVRQHVVPDKPFSTLVSVLCAGSVIIAGLRMIEGARPTREEFDAFVAAAGVVGIVIPFLMTGRYRRLTGRDWERTLLIMAAMAGALLLECGFQFASESQGTVFCLLYTAAAALGLGLRSWGRETAEV